MTTEAAKGVLRETPPPSAAATGWLGAALKLLLPRPARNGAELRGLAQEVPGQEPCAAALLLLLLMAPGDKMVTGRGRARVKCPAWRPRVLILRGAV